MPLQPNLFFPLVVFCIVTLFTPGPNNVMLMTSGLNFGLRRTIGAMLGVALGFAFLVLCVGLGLGAIFKAYPIMYVVLKYLGALYMLYLAWMIAKSPPPTPDISRQKAPMNFWKAAAFQWINPKGWVMAVSSVAAYGALAHYPLNILLIAGLFGFFGLSSSVSWACLGSVLQKFLHRPKIVRAFNLVMAIALVASLYPIFSEAISP